MKPVLKYPGAKNRLAEWITSYIPEHTVYLEPYFGSGAVFFNKQRCHIETVNDLHNEVAFKDMKNGRFNVTTGRGYALYTEMLHAINLTIRFLEAQKHRDL